MTNPLNPQFPNVPPPPPPAPGPQPSHGTGQPSAQPAQPAWARPNEWSAHEAAPPATPQPRNPQRPVLPPTAAAPAQDNRPSPLKDFNRMLMWVVVIGVLFFAGKMIVSHTSPKSEPQAEALRINETQVQPQPQSQTQQTSVLPMAAASEDENHLMGGSMPEAMPAGLESLMQQQAAISDALASSGKPLPPMTDLYNALQKYKDRPMAKKFVADALATTGVEQQYKSQHLTDPQLVTAVVLSPKFPLSLNKFMGNPEFLSLYAEVLNDPAVINARAGNNAAAREAMVKQGEALKNMVDLLNKMGQVPETVNR